MCHKYGGRLGWVAARASAWRPRRRCEVATAVALERGRGAGATPGFRSAPVSRTVRSRTNGSAWPAALEGRGDRVLWGRRERRRPGRGAAACRSSSYTKLAGCAHRRYGRGGGGADPRSVNVPASPDALGLGRHAWASSYPKLAGCSHRRYGRGGGGAAPRSVNVPASPDALGLGRHAWASSYTKSPAAPLHRCCPRCALRGRWTVSSACCR